MLPKRNYVPLRRVTLTWYQTLVTSAINALLAQREALIADPNRIVDTDRRQIIIDKHDLFAWTKIVIQERVYNSSSSIVLQESHKSCTKTYEEREKLNVALPNQ